MTKDSALYNIEGRIGKTSAAVNLAWSAADEGARVLLETSTRRARQATCCGSPPRCVAAAPSS